VARLVGSTASKFPNGCSRNDGGHCSSKRSFSSTSFGFAGLEHEFSVVSHTPVFSHQMARMFLSGGQESLKDARGNPNLQLMDMTFGSGGHADVILNHQLADRVERLVVCDCDRLAHNESKELSARSPEGKVLPLRSRFSDLPNKILDQGIHPGSFDGILIDVAGCSAIQWAEPARGFCPNKAGSMDLRYDPDDPSPTNVTASQLLQHVSDRDLFRIIRSYSCLSPKMSKYAANAVIEARYMFHRFKTTQELYEVMRSAAQRYCTEDRSSSPDSPSERDLSKRMMREVLTALRLFVNDSPNQLNFAINTVAKNFLRPPTATSPGGTLVVIVDTEAERRVVESCLTLVDDISTMSTNDIHLSDSMPVSSDISLSSDSLVPDTAEAVSYGKSWLSWRSPGQPLELTPAEKTLYPRLENAKMFSAHLNS